MTSYKLTTGSTLGARNSLAEVDHYSNMPTGKNVELGGERLTPPHRPPPPPPKKKSFGSLPAPRSGYATAIMVVFLLIYSS